MVRSAIPLVLAPLLLVALVPPTASVAPLDDDAGSGGDAGDWYPVATPLELGTYEGRLTYGTDLIDMYLLDAEPGDVFHLNANAPNPDALMMTVYHAPPGPVTGREISRVGAPGFGWENNYFATVMPGHHFLVIEIFVGTGVATGPLSYEFELTDVTDDVDLILFPDTHDGAPLSHTVTWDAHGPSTAIVSAVGWTDPDEAARASIQRMVSSSGTSPSPVAAGSAPAEVSIHRDGETIVRQAPPSLDAILDESKWRSQSHNWFRHDPGPSAFRLDTAGTGVFLHTAIVVGGHDVAVEQRPGSAYRFDMVGDTSQNDTQLVAARSHDAGAIAFDVAPGYVGAALTPPSVEAWFVRPDGHHVVPYRSDRFVDPSFPGTWELHHEGSTTRGNQPVRPLFVGAQFDPLPDWATP